MVLSDGLFLTAAEIATMDPIPELVFLNCCHLGEMGGMASNKMAASISSELIRKGVRAVVAAGWPVQDDAALCFADGVTGSCLLAGHFSSGSEASSTTNVGRIPVFQYMGSLSSLWRS